MRSRAQSAASLAERISLARDVALNSMAFFSMRRGFDLSLTLASQVLRLLPESRGSIFNFLFGKKIRASNEAVVVLANNGRPDLCAVRAGRS